MNYILNIETATKNCSVCLAHNGAVVASRELAGSGYSHAEKLHVFIEEIMAEAEISLRDLSAVAVSQGPGSYTGLRIGVSAAKGLCYALGIPLIAVDTMLTLAKQVAIDQGLIVTMLDARRMEVYGAVFDAQHQRKSDTKAQVITSESFQDLEGKVYFAGDGVAKCKSVLKRESVVFLDTVVFPSAIEMAVLSFEQHKKSDYVDVAYFEPFYLKEFFTGK